MRNAYAKGLYEIAKKDDKIFCLIADIGSYILRDFKRDFPKRFFNMGIAEANMMGVAAGLALCDKIPFVYTITPFVTARCYDQIRVDICYQNLNVKIVGIGSGIVYGTAGPSHHSIEDIAIMRVLPNMTIIVPSDYVEVDKAIRAVANYSGPTYFRLGITSEGVIHNNNYKFEIGKADLLRDGKDVTLIASGTLVNNALVAAKNLLKDGIDARVINLHTIKPIDRESIIKAARETGAILTAEEHSIIGGLGSAVAEILAEENIGNILFKRIGLQDCFCLDYGEKDYLQQKYKISSANISEEVRTLLKK